MTIPKHEAINMNMPRVSQQPGAMAALCASLLFGAGTLLAKQLLSGVEPWMLARLLYLGSGLGLGAWRLVRRALPVKLPLDQWLWLVGAILASGVAGPVLLMFGLARMPASGASLLLNAERRVHVLVGLRSRRSRRAP